MLLGSKQSIKKWLDHNVSDGGQQFYSIHSSDLVLKKENAERVCGPFRVRCFSCASYTVVVFLTHPLLIFPEPVVIVLAQQRYVRLLSQLLSRASTVIMLRSYCCFSPCAYTIACSVPTF